MATTTTPNTNSQPMKIGFTGNRHGLSYQQKEEIKAVLDKYDNIIASHGDCVGSDTEFHNLCVEHREKHPEKQITIHIYPPNIPTMRAFNKADVLMDEKPYLERNTDIVKNSSILIACPVDKNKEQLRSGTWSTVRKARKMNIPIHLF